LTKYNTICGGSMRLSRQWMWRSLWRRTALLPAFQRNTLLPNSG